MSLFEKQLKVCELLEILRIKCPSIFNRYDAIYKELEDSIERTEIYKIEGQLNSIQIEKVLNGIDGHFNTMINDISFIIENL